MAYFQVPDDRVLQSPGSKIPAPWPATPDGYRLFVSGASGNERIGIQLGQKIELEIVGGKDLYLETKESMLVRNMARTMSGDAVVAFGNAIPALIVVSALVATTDKQKIVVRGQIPGSTALYVFDPASNAVKAELEVVVGNFESHPGMSVDLIADVCRGSDSLKIHALQRMLNNNTFLSVDSRGYNTFNNGDNIFEQHADPNISPDRNIGGMSCGLVARWRTEQVFPKIIAPDKFDWYVVGSIHERLSGTPANRKDVKYRSSKVEFLRAQILKALGDGAAVRVAVVDSPTSMTPQNGVLVAYGAGGHTVVIVGCNANGTEFFYIDPWGGGSQMIYGGGISGAKFSDPCLQIGKFIVAHDPDRRAAPGDVGNNIIREHPDTQGTFTYAQGNYLEVVAGPFPAPR